MDRTGYLRLGGVAVGASIAYTIVHSFYAAVAIPIYMICVLAAVGASELMSPRPSRSTERTARLAARDVDAYLPPGARRHLRILAVVTAVTIPATVFMLSGAPFGVLQHDAVVNMFALLPAAVMLAGWAVLATRILRRIAESGHAGLSPHQLAADDAWRRRAAHLVHGTTGVLLAGPLTGTLFFVSQQIVVGWLPDWGLLMAGGVLPAVVSLVVFAHYLRLLTHPGPFGEVTAVSETPFATGDLATADRGRTEATA